LHFDCSNEFWTPTPLYFPLCRLVFFSQCKIEKNLAGGFCRIGDAISYMTKKEAENHFGFRSSGRGI
ncbi:MAG: hypothetical protein IIW99_00505, partial [Treponema sp.]|nr:hypothetical protein [Treponema sp.]